MAHELNHEEREAVRTIPCPHESGQGGCGALMGEWCRMGGPSVERTETRVHAARERAWIAGATGLDGLKVTTQESAPDAQEGAEEEEEDTDDTGAAESALRELEELAARVGAPLAEVAPHGGKPSAAELEQQSNEAAMLHGLHLTDMERLRQLAMDFRSWRRGELPRDVLMHRLYYLIHIVAEAP